MSNQKQWRKLNDHLEDGELDGFREELIVMGKHYLTEFRKAGLLPNEVGFGYTDKWSDDAVVITFGELDDDHLQIKITERNLVEITIWNEYDANVVNVIKKLKQWMKDWTQYED